jgi:hypothetical protein
MTEKVLINDILGTMFYFRSAAIIRKLLKALL